MNGIEQGMTQLAAWQRAQPDNFFTNDRNLQRTLEHRMGAQQYQQRAPQLYRFGGVAATTLDAAARVSNERANLPRLERLDGIGRPVEDVAYHPSYHEAGRLIYGSGAMSVLDEPGANLMALALFYLSGQNGEAGHNCPLACTAGVIKVLQQVAEPALRDRFLPALLDADYDQNLTGAQYVTEVQGGSDVGANATVATPEDADGVWRLDGRKWFCSNVTADLALVTARVPEQGDGTSGLGLFLVPRRLEDGRPNGMRLERLKEKLGTASLATAEVVFEGALAYQAGDTADGFKTLMQHVINTSRIYNAVGTSANARRAYVTAWTYAQHRHAFGHPILHFPLVQVVLTQMRTDATALASGSFMIARWLDDLELGRGDADTASLIRAALNINKVRSALLAHEVINQGIELLGGNGTIETFSVLPRLLRDNVVYENWEGTHNVLAAQVQRDFRRYELHKPLLNWIGSQFRKTLSETLRDEGDRLTADLSAELEALFGNLPSADMASIYFRPLMLRLADLFYLACMATESSYERALYQDRSKERMAEFFLHRRLTQRPLKDWPDYGEWAARLCTDARPWRIDADDHWEGMDDPMWE